MKDYELKKLKIKIHGYDTVQALYRKSEYTREEIRNLSQHASDNLKKEKFNGELLINLYSPQIGWRGAEITQVGDPVKMFTVDTYDDSTAKDPEFYTRFSIILMKKGEPKGGNDKNNDCLYNCLMEIIPEATKKVFPTAKDLKDYLELNVNDKVGIENIPKIEEKLQKYKINVVGGEYTYTSTKKSMFAIQLHLSHEHYSVNIIPESFKAYGISFTERNPLIIKQIEKEPSKYLCYGKCSGKVRMFAAPKEEIDKLKKKPINCEYVIFRSDKDKKGNYISLKETYANIVRDANILKELTNGRINLFKTGSERTTALKLFYDLNKGLQVEEINQDESIWIENAQTGPIMYGEKYEGKAYKYDVCSMYPSIMKGQDFSIPIKRGEFSIMTQREFENREIIKYGIYRCVIKNKSNKHKLFRFNPKNYYTQYDLAIANELDFEIKLIQDNQPNALIYNRDCRIQGNKLFKEYVDLLFPLKKAGIDRAKKILNTLWGALVQKNEFTIQYDQSSDEICEIRGDKKVVSFTPTNNQCTCFAIRLAKIDKFYETNFARLGPFLLSFARMKIANIILPYSENVKRIHTDGFICTKKLRKSLLCIKEGNDIGQLRYEGYCSDVVIENCMRVVGEFQ
jgi:hypothetical protein